MTKDRTGERFIPPGAIKIADKASSAIAYIYTDAHGRPCARGYHGRAGKPDFAHWFRNEAQRDRTIAEHFGRWQRHEAYAEEQRLARQGQVNPYKVGDVLRSCWGYEQTNVEWYEIREIRGKYVVIQEIACESEGTGWLQGRSVPCPGRFIGEPMRRLGRPVGIRINDVITAYKEEPTEVAGVKAYRAAAWSAYH